LACLLGKGGIDEIGVRAKGDGNPRIRRVMAADGRTLF
jgi:hypothetical protein